MVATAVLLFAGWIKRQNYCNGGAFVYFAVSGNGTKVIFHYFFTQGKAQTRSCSMLQFFEQVKNGFLKCRIKPNALIPKLQFYKILVLILILNFPKTVLLN